MNVFRTVLQVEGRIGIQSCVPSEPSPGGKRAAGVQLPTFVWHNPEDKGKVGKALTLVLKSLMFHTFCLKPSMFWLKYVRS